MKIKMLERPIGGMPIDWTIATSAEEFEAVQKHHKVDARYVDEWQLHSDQYDGTTHYFDRLIIVCVSLDVQSGVLVHEAVHVFEAMMRMIGETKPGEETRAYCTQFIYETMANEIKARSKHNA